MYSGIRAMLVVVFANVTLQLLIQASEWEKLNSLLLGLLEFNFPPGHNDQIISVGSPY